MVLLGSTQRYDFGTDLLLVAVPVAQIPQVLYTLGFGQVRKAEKYKRYGNEVSHSSGKSNFNLLHTEI